MFPRAGEGKVAEVVSGLEGPPLSLPFARVLEWAGARSLGGASAYRCSDATGASCIALTFVAPPCFLPPPTFGLSGRTYRLGFFPVVSEAFRKAYPEMVAVARPSLRDFLTNAKLSTLPPEAEEAVLSVVGSYEPDLLALVKASGVVPSGVAEVPAAAVSSSPPSVGPPGSVSGPPPLSRASGRRASDASPFSPKVGSGLGPLTSAFLSSVPQADRKQAIGDRLFPLVKALVGGSAGKITGMLLEMDEGPLLRLLDGSDPLPERVGDAVQALQEYAGSVGFGSSPPPSGDRLGSSTSFSL